MCLINSCTVCSLCSLVITAIFVLLPFPCAWWSKAKMFQVCFFDNFMLGVFLVLVEGLGGMGATGPELKKCRGPHATIKVHIDRTRFGNATRIFNFQWHLTSIFFYVFQIFGTTYPILAIWSAYLVNFLSVDGFNCF
jgi:hypothetical protein